MAIKVNLNSGDYNANQTCEMAYVVIDSLKQFGVPAQKMKVMDVVRRFPDYWHERWSSDVAYVNQDSVVWDPNAQVYFPAIDVWHRFPTVLSQANHIINLALQKGHKGYVTGSMKNHFGSQEDPEALHIERFDNICQLAASPFIAGRTRLIVIEGSFMTWHNEGYPFEETANGLQTQEYVLCTLNPAALGKTDTAKASTANARDQLLDREIFYTLREAQVLIERWRREYNTFRPHSSLNYRQPAPETILTTWIVGTTPGDPLPILGGQGTIPLT